MNPDVRDSWHLHWGVNLELGYRFALPRLLIDTWDSYWLGAWRASIGPRPGGRAAGGSRAGRGIGWRVCEGEGLNRDAEWPGRCAGFPSVWGIRCIGPCPAGGRGRRPTPLCEPASRPKRGALSAMRLSAGWNPRRATRGAPRRWLSAAADPLAVVLLLLFLLLPPPGLGSSQERIQQACDTCRGITKRFSKGLTDTAKKNFGGGNTAWEEKTLSKYETSEIRLVEIIENLCDSSNFECNNMVEEHEEHIETWWFKWKKKYPDLFNWFCIETIKVCCPSGTHGPDCVACRGGSERPCHGNGHCDGDGTRGGDGSCSCKKEYKGDFCLECSDGYYNSYKNESHSVCTACHDSCKTCTGATNKDCKDCKDGWIRNEEACVDVDECAVDDPPCSTDEYCLNTDGSFSCKACDISCSGCTGEGPTKCKACVEGYEMKDDKCTDVDECTLSEKLCVRENEECINTPGGYKCACSEGFQEKDSVCVPTVKVDETPANVSASDAHEDL